jgi:DNA-binding NarL/FixJ family response regulator
MANLVKRDDTTLTRRQQQVCDLICQGRSNKEIARVLAISPRTVEDHRLDVMAKMAVPNSTALVHKVLSARIAELEATYGAS